MRQFVQLAILAGALTSSAALAAEPWEHQGMQSHHRSAPPAERPLAPGETRVGRITIGAPAEPTDRVPDTLEQTTQRQWRADRGRSAASR